MLTDAHVGEGVYLKCLREHPESYTFTNMGKLPNKFSHYLSIFVIR